MSPNVSRLFSEAMAMPPELRALLASQLLETLDDHPAHGNTQIEEMERAHLSVVNRRLEEIKSGRVETISSEVAAERIHRALGK